jgi:hypothetical protein
LYPHTDLGDFAAATTFDISGDDASLLPSFDGYWYLLRPTEGGGTYCNQTGVTYGSTARDTQLP